MHMLKLLQLTTILPQEWTTELSLTSKVPWSYLKMLNSQGKPFSTLVPLSSTYRYAEIVNVRLGDGSMRKGQVLEIAGKRAVV